MINSPESQPLEVKLYVTKRCTICQEVKPVDSFTKRPDDSQGFPRWRGDCKSCRSKRTLGWHKKNPERSAEIRRRNHFKNSYGITVAEYDAMLAEQGGVCAICKKAETHRINGEVCRLAVDHCHATKKVRGILCAACNRTMGLIDDNVETLAAMITYINSYKE